MRVRARERERERETLFASFSCLPFFLCVLLYAKNSDTVKAFKTTKQVTSGNLSVTIMDRNLVFINKLHESKMLFSNLLGDTINDLALNEFSLSLSLSHYLSKQERIASI